MGLVVCDLGLIGKQGFARVLMRITGLHAYDFGVNSRRRQC